MNIRWQCISVVFFLRLKEVWGKAFAKPFLRKWKWNWFIIENKWRYTLRSAFLFWEVPLYGDKNALTFSIMLHRVEQVHTYLYPLQRICSKSNIKDTDMRLSCQWKIVQAHSINYRKFFACFRYIFPPINRCHVTMRTFLPLRIFVLWVNKAV